MAEGDAARRLRVLVVTHVFPRRADDPSAPFLLTWARALAGAGADVGVVAPHDAGLPERHVVAGVPVRRVRYGPDRWERLAYRGEMHRLARSPAGPPLVASLLGALARQIALQVRRGHPDVIAVHWWLPGAIAVRLARPATPAVLTVHGTDVALLESEPRLVPLARWALAACDRVEAVSTDLAERLERATGRAADAVNPMPLETPGAATPRPAPARQEGPLRVLAVGRLVPEKGFADLLAAAARVRHPVAVTIVGDGPERGALARLAADLGVDLRLAGPRSPAQLRDAYADAGVVVQASHREGFGLVAAEALCRGVPVVATDSGGARDVLDRAHLVDVGDVDGLAARLEAVGADLAAARRAAVVRGEALRTLLSPQAAAARTLAGYRALVT